MASEMPVYYEFQSMRIIPQDKSAVWGSKKYEQMINDGWELVSKDDSLILRGGIYTFRRQRPPTKKELTARLAEDTEVNQPPPD